MKTDTTKKGQMTIKTAGVFFMLSAVFQLFNLIEPVPLFGALRSGTVVIIYHLIYLILFAAIGWGLWNGKSYSINITFYL